MKDNNTPSQRAAFFIDLDSLMDTRMATLIRLHEHALGLAIRSGYYERTTDDFPGIRRQDYRSLYESRDTKTLRYSVVTEMVNVIRSYIYNVRQNTLNTPFKIKPEIILNIHPYKLTEEAIDVLIRGLVTAIHGEADVSVVEMTPLEIHPLYLKQNVGTIAMYDYDVWLEVHTQAKTFEKYSCPEVVLQAPRIYKDPDNIPSTEPTKEPFTFMEVIASPFIKLMFMDIRVFCSMIDLRTLKRPEPDEGTQVSQG